MPKQFLSGSSRDVWEYIAHFCKNDKGELNTEFHTPPPPPPTPTTTQITSHHTEFPVSCVLWPWPPHGHVSASPVLQPAARTWRGRSNRPRHPDPPGDNDPVPELAGNP